MKEDMIMWILVNSVKRRCQVCPNHQVHGNGRDNASVGKQLHGPTTMTGMAESPNRMTSYDNVYGGNEVGGSESSRVYAPNSFHYA
jgi:hypothetical protein